MFNCFDRIPACDKQTDGQTDILGRNSPLYTEHRAVKTKQKKTGTAFHQVHCCYHWQSVSAVY